MGAKHITGEEQKLIKESMKAGYTLKEIAELTGRSYQTIKVYARKFKKEECEMANVTNEPENDQKKDPETYVWDHRDDPFHKLHIEIKKHIRITGNETEFRYTVDDEILVIHNNRGEEMHIEMKIFDDFLDELVDISAEARRAKNWVE